MLTGLALGVGLVVLVVLGRLQVRPPAGATWGDLDVPARVPRGSNAHVRLAVHVEGPSTWVRFDGGVTRPIAPVVEWPINTMRRGIQFVGPTTLEFANPFGLGRRVLATREPSRVLVVPRVHSAPKWLPTDGLSTTDGRERSGTEHFDSLRAYASGDPMNSVHWRSSARTGQLMVRRMVETSVPTLLVVLDVDCASYDRTQSSFRDFDPDAFEEAVDLAASWCAANATTAQRVLLTTTAADAPVIEVTMRNRHSAEDWLALVQPVQRTLPARLSTIAQRRGTSRIVVISGPQARQRWASQDVTSNVEIRVVGA